VWGIRVFTSEQNTKRNASGHDGAWLYLKLIMLP
jgi:hypothetical protein